MNIILEPFNSIDTISFRENRTEIRKRFDNKFNATINKFNGTESDYYLSALFEVEYKNQKPILIMVNPKGNTVKFNEIIISQLRPHDVVDLFGHLDDEIYRDSSGILLLKTGIGFYFEDVEEDEVAQQICIFEKGGKYFEDMMDTFEKIVPPGAVL